jgi:hypothetical protein
MKSTPLICSARLAMALVGFAAMVEAAPITYLESGIASGTLGGTTFTNALVQVTLSGNTANVVTLTDGTITVFVNLSSLTTVTIAGIGTATITDPNAMYSFPAPVGIADGFPVLPYVIFGTLDHSPALDSFTGFGGQGSNALLGYDLTTSIGPITGSPGGVDYPTRTFLHTTLGNLAFTENLTPTGTGTFTAIVTPEPMSLLLLGSGLVMFGGISRFRTRA